MSLVFYVGDSGPVPAIVTDGEGNFATPVSATATVVNVHNGEVVALNEACLVGEGVASWIMPVGHAASITSARYVAYITVTLDATTKTTASVPFDVLDKSSYLIVDRWRRKVEFSAPNDEAISDQEGRDWIDQAVSHLNGQWYNTGYTSVLGSLTPNEGVDAAGQNEIEFIASVAALMARTAWWAGKGNWRDEEMSLDVGPFHREWEQLKGVIVTQGDNAWYSGVSDPLEQHNMYNRDKVNRLGHPDEPDNYYDAAWWGDN